ncbi:glycosyl transferase, partial [Falsihalocynthiibacter sp. S25ZX9]
MAKIAYILLCHKDQEAIILQAKRLTATGDYMAIHFDASASQAHFAEIGAALKGNSNVVFSKKRIN